MALASKVHYSSLFFFFPWLHQLLTEVQHRSTRDTPKKYLMTNTQIQSIHIKLFKVMPADAEHCSEQCKCLPGRQAGRCLRFQKNWQTETKLPMNSMQLKEMPGLCHYNKMDSKSLDNKKCPIL